MSHAALSSSSDVLESEAATTVLNFSDLGLPEALLKALEMRGYTQPSAIQAEAIPYLLEGADLIGQAQTGTGKTAAFALPLLANLDAKLRKPQVLVVAPTRELALQVADAFEAYAKFMPGVRVQSIYGGQGYANQMRGIKQGAQVIVGTPGRLLDHLNRGSLDMQGLQALVLDEADEMLRMGFIDDIEAIMSKVPENSQTVMFSATLPAPIRRIAVRYLKDPREIKIAARTTTVEKIQQSYLLLDNRQKPEALVRLLHTEPYEGVMVFVRTKASTAQLAEKLLTLGFAAAALNGDMSQTDRERTIDQLKRGNVKIVIATDVAARGLDVEHISLVINYDMPHDPESYVHRIGRTGRAGRDGRAILLVTHRERRLLAQIEKTTRSPMTRGELPSDEVLEERHRQALKDRVTEAMASDDLHLYRESLTTLQEELGVATEDLLPALLLLARKDQPIQNPKKAKRKQDERGKRDDMREAREERNPRQKRENRRRERDAEPSVRHESMTRDSNDGKVKELRAKTKKPRTNKPVRDEDVAFDRYRLEVGKQHKARIADIVGAIANEADIDSRYIGSVELFDNHSIVELPEGMPKDVYQHLKRFMFAK